MADTEDFEITLGEEPNSAVCEKCGTRYFVGDDYRCPHGPLHFENANHFDPVVIHEGPNGRIRFPAHANAPIPAGFHKKELTTIGEVRRFQRRVNQIEDSKIRQQIEHECEVLETQESANRSDLFNMMRNGGFVEYPKFNDRGQVVGMERREVHFSEKMKAFAQVAMNRNNSIRPRSQSANFTIEPFEMDQSNRDAYRDERDGFRSKRR